MSNQEFKDDLNDYFNNLLAELRAKDPQFEERIEYGNLLMKHIDDFTPGERKRYYELKETLKDI
jgi:hypothetical protein